MGHSKAVADINFDNSGAQFLSAGYDRQMKLWDTETGEWTARKARARGRGRREADECLLGGAHAGQCKQAFSNGKIPYCIKFHPDQPTTFLAGMSDKKIVQVSGGFAADDILLPKNEG